MAILLPEGKQSFETSTGAPLVGGKVFTYDAGTTNPRVTYADAGQITPNANPVILDGRGEATIFWAGAYKVQLQDSLGNIIWTQDNVTTISGSNVILDNYSVDSGVVNAYVAAGAAAISALVVGLRFSMKIGTTNTGASTVNYVGLGAKTITLQNGGALNGGELQANGIYEFEYDGVNFQLLDPAVGFWRTAAEIAGGAVVVDYTIPNHEATGICYVDRYRKNVTPGTTDMGPAVQAAINVALSVLGAGQAGPAIRFRTGAYLIGTVLTFGGATINILPLDIGGQGPSTQLINGLPSGTGYLFQMAGKNGWKLHDFLMCGSTANKNGGIEVNTVGGAQSIEWEVERVISMMAGIGIKVADTNTGVIRDFWHWPGNNPPLIVAQAVTAADISHGIWMTGSFVHNLHILDPIVNGNSGYGAGAMRGIKMDCTFSYGVAIDGNPLAQTLSGLFNEISIDIAPTNAASEMRISNLYNEGATLRLVNVQDSIIGPVTNGGDGSALRLEGTTRFNTFYGIRQGIIDQLDATGAAQANVFIGCTSIGAHAWSAATPYFIGNYVSNGGVQYRCILAHTNQVPPNVTYWTVCQTYNDANEAINISAIPNRLIGCAVGGGVQGDLGFMWRKLLAYSANMTSDVYGPNHNVVRVNNAAAMTINFPAHPRNGVEQQFTIRNESGGAMGVITWFVTVGGWVNPANGFNRTIVFYYDSDFGAWKVKWVGTVDQPN